MALCPTVRREELMEVQRRLLEYQHKNAALIKQNDELQATVFELNKWKSEISDIAAEADASFQLQKNQWDEERLALDRRNNTIAEERNRQHHELCTIRNQLEQAKKAVQSKSDELNNLTIQHRDFVSQHDGLPGRVMRLQKEVDDLRRAIDNKTRENEEIKSMQAAHNAKQLQTIEKLQDDLESLTQAKKSETAKASRSLAAAEASFNNELARIEGERLRQEETSHANLKLARQEAFTQGEIAKKLASQLAASNAVVNALKEEACETNQAFEKLRAELAEAEEAKRAAHAEAVTAREEAEKARLSREEAVGRLQRAAEAAADGTEEAMRVVHEYDVATQQQQEREADLDRRARDIDAQQAELSKDKAACATRVAELDKIRARQEAVAEETAALQAELQTERQELDKRHAAISGSAVALHQEQEAIMVQQTRLNDALAALEKMHAALQAADAGGAAGLGDAFVANNSVELVAEDGSAIPVVSGIMACVQTEQRRQAALRREVQGLEAARDAAQRQLGKLKREELEAQSKVRGANAAAAAATAAAERAEQRQRAAEAAAVRAEQQEHVAEATAERAEQQQRSAEATTERAEQQQRAAEAAAERAVQQERAVEATAKRAKQQQRAAEATAEQVKQRQRAAEAAALSPMPSPGVAEVAEVLPKSDAVPAGSGEQDAEEVEAASGIFGAISPLLGRLLGGASRTSATSKTPVAAVKQPPSVGGETSPVEFSVPGSVLEIAAPTPQLGVAPSQPAANRTGRTPAGRTPATKRTRTAIHSQGSAGGSANVAGAEAGAGASADPLEAERGERTRRRIRQGSAGNNGNCSVHEKGQQHKSPAAEAIVAEGAAGGDTDGAGVEARGDGQDAKVQGGVASAVGEGRGDEAGSAIPTAAPPPGNTAGAKKVTRRLGAAAAREAGQAPAAEAASQAACSSPADARSPLAIAMETPLAEPAAATQGGAAASQKVTPPTIRTGKLSQVAATAATEGPLAAAGRSGSVRARRGPVTPTVPHQRPQRAAASAAAAAVAADAADNATPSASADMPSTPGARPRRTRRTTKRVQMLLEEAAQITGRTPSELVPDEDTAPKSARAARSASRAASKAGRESSVVEDGEEVEGGGHDGDVDSAEADHHRKRRWRRTQTGTLRTPSEMLPHIEEEDDFERGL